MFLVLAIAAVCFGPPVPGPIVAGYAPSGQYAGHWGVDFAAAIGDPVRAPVSGRVTFAGSVAGMKSVTLEPVPGFKVSLSYLLSVGVRTGDHLRKGDVIGRAGSPHGKAGVHLSTRFAGRYVDPVGQMGCRATDVSRALRLVMPPQPYARRRANRNPRRDVRSHPHRPSPRRRIGPPPVVTRQGLGDPRRRSLAEVTAVGIARRGSSGDVPAFRSWSAGIGRRRP